MKNIEPQILVMETRAGDHRASNVGYGGSSWQSSNPKLWKGKRGFPVNTNPVIAKLCMHKKIKKPGAQRVSVMLNGSRSHALYMYIYIYIWFPYRITELKPVAVIRVVSFVFT